MSTFRRGFPIWSLLIGLTAVLGFGLVIAVVSNTRAPAGNLAQATMSLPPSASNTPVPQPTAPMTPATETLVPEEPTATDVPTPDEQATWDYIATDDAWKQIVGITAAYLATNLPTATAGPTGIYDNQYVKAYLSKYGFDVENAWFGLVNSNHVSVFAGAPHDNPAQGTLRVYLDLPEGLHEQDYPTPISAGTVRVVAEQNNRLTLISTDGMTFFFDVPGLQFVGSLTEIVPTITPYMSETPGATWTPGPTQTPVATCTPGPTPTGWPGQSLPPPC